jgi:hippurate hydrolase
MSAPSLPARYTPVLQRLGALKHSLTVFALDLHQHPELSGEEVRTASCLADALTATGFDVTRGVGGHGVVGVLSNGHGPRVMLRTELDGLPIEERTGLPYTAVGSWSHACGHDLHTAAVLGAATLLAQTKEHWHGTIVVVGQPAEKTLSGAQAMLRDGLYSHFGRPDVVLAQHSAPLLAGMVAPGRGGDPLLAGSVGLEITLHGRGGHAGTAHLSVNPVLAAAAVALRLQSVVERECATAGAATCTVGYIQAGVRSDVIPDSVTLGISIRAFSPDAVDRIRATVEQVVRDEATAAGCVRPADITVVSQSSPTFSDQETTAEVYKVHRKVLGREKTVRWPPSMATRTSPSSETPAE